MSIPIAYGSTTSKRPKKALKRVLAIEATKAVEVATNADIVASILVSRPNNPAYLYLRKHLLFDP